MRTGAGASPLWIPHHQSAYWGTPEEKISTLFTHPPALKVLCLRVSLKHPAEGAGPRCTPHSDREMLRAGAGGSRLWTAHYSSAC